MNQTSLVGRPLHALVSSIVGFAEKRGVWSGPLTSSSPELARLWAAPAASSGVHVSQTSALSVSAFFAAVTTIGWDVGSLPLFLYKRLPKGGKIKFSDHPLYPVLKDSPNPEQTAFQFRAALMVNVLCTGAAFAEIVRNGMGRPSQLWHLDPARVCVIRTRGELGYRVTQPDGGTVTIDARDMIHVRGPSPDGVVGFDMVAIARDALGLAMASERFGGKFFSNGAQLGGILSTNVTEAGRKNLREALDSQHQGVDRAHRWLVAPPDTTFTPVGNSPRDSQMVEAREHEVREIARFFKIPVAMIGDLSRATWSNYEQMQLQYFQTCLRPWLVNIEQEFNTKLISPLERTQQSIEHVIEGFLRADVEKRGAFYVQMLGNGVMTINECRERENLPPIPGGDVARVPMNTEALTAPEPTAEPARMMIVGAAHRSLVINAVGRWLVKLCDRAQRQSNPDKLKLWAAAELKDGVFRADFVDKTRGEIRALMSTLDRAHEADALAERLAAYCIDTYFPALRAIAEHYTGEEFTDALNREVVLWRDTERLHHMIDHLIQYGTPPPVETRLSPRPALASIGGTRDVRMLKLLHRQHLAECDLQIAKRQPMRQTA